MLRLTLVNFAFKWTHRDGSIVEFAPTGRTSNDPLKADWLSKMNQLSSSGPAIPPAIRNWLQEECELIDFSGSSVLIVSELLFAIGFAGVLLRRNLIAKDYVGRQTNSQTNVPHNAKSNALVT